MKKLSVRCLAGILAALFALLIIIYPAVSADAAKNALLLCGNVLIPSLLPFFICSYILIYSGIAHRVSGALSRIMKPLFAVNGSGAVALVCGLLSGYPTGAAVTAKLYTSGCINKNEAERLICFTNNSGPLFILGAVGAGIYQSKAAGIILLVSHISAALTMGIVLRFFGTSSANTKKPAQSNPPVLSAFSDAVSSVLGLCGFVIFFAVVLSVLKACGFINILSSLFIRLGIDSATASLVSQGIFEITTAIASAKTNFLPAVSCVLAWGGASVFVQTAAIAKSAGLSVKKYIPVKLICGGISAFYTKLMLCFVPVTLPVFNPLSESIKKAGVFTCYLALSICISAAVLFVFSLFSKRTYK